MCLDSESILQKQHELQLLMYLMFETILCQGTHGFKQRPDILNLLLKGNTLPLGNGELATEVISQAALFFKKNFQLL